MEESKIKNDGNEHFDSHSSESQKTDAVDTIDYPTLGSRTQIISRHQLDHGSI
jgi:hypothetical protein